MENTPAIEVIAFRYMQASDGSQRILQGNVDIPFELAKQYEEITKKDCMLACELLTTGEVAWYIDHVYTQHTLAIEIAENRAMDKEYHLEVIKKLFAQLQNKDIDQEIKEAENDEQEGNEANTERTINRAKKED